MLVILRTRFTKDSNSNGLDNWTKSVIEVNTRSLVKPFDSKGRFIRRYCAIEISSNEKTYLQPMMFKR